MNEIIHQLKILQKLQCRGHVNFSDGLFEVERTWAKGLYRRADNTGFFAACIAFTLKRYLKQLSPEALQLAEQIIEEMKPVFSLFRNKDGHASYNFWQTIPSKHFPGGHFARHFKFFMIPDDIDDSALIHLVFQHSPEDQLALKEKMRKYAIGILKWPDMPIKGYESFKPYNTFFVKNMPASFDVCALCNSLYFIRYYGLPWQEQDQQSLELIIKCIDNDDHLNRPYAMAPYYPNPILILYHIIRLSADLQIEALTPYHNKLLGQCETIIKKGNLHPVEYLMVIICIRKLKKQKFEIPPLNSNNMREFPFFVAGILGEVSPKWIRKMGSSSLSHIHYICEAYAQVLWLEHLILNQFAE